MRVSEKWGGDVDAAVELALKELKLTIDEVDVEVLEESSKGFLGIGSKLAKSELQQGKRSRIRRRRVPLMISTESWLLYLKIRK